MTGIILAMLINNSYLIYQDVDTTMYIASHGYGVEANPLARPFVDSNNGTTLLACALLANAGASYLFSGNEYASYLFQALIATAETAIYLSHTMRVRQIEVKAIIYVMTF